MHAGHSSGTVTQMDRAVCCHEQLCHGLENIPKFKDTMVMKGKAGGVTCPWIWVLL